ncbi:MAG: aminomethyltransferase [Solirubrobacterales bacterium]|jgi:glycine cleavage system aminomethyltransferase T|nr:aminomethyltransferase [Solirubrobacterales bacterium]
MSFEFLAADATSSLAGEVPVARSPIEWVHRRAGAQFATRAGWRAVAGYGADGAESDACRRTVGVADLSFLGKLELQGNPGDVAAIVAELAGGARLAPGRAADADGTWWCPITAGRVIAVTLPESTAALRESLEAAGDRRPGFVSVVELTTALSSNAVVGPLARETFARATALDLRPQRFEEAAFAPVSVARVPGMILREHGDRFLHLFGAGYANYVWTVFKDAAEALGGRVVGTEAVGRA